MDNENPFQAPAAELLADKPPAHNQRLYSVAAVGLGTFFGTSVAGAYFIVQNLKALGRESEANTVWAIGIGLFVAMTLAGFFLPDNIPAVVFVLPPLFAMNAYARQLFGPLLLGHKASNGPFYSLWRVAGIGLLFSAAVVGLMVAVLMLTGYA